jgi:hypothetical protein
MIPSIHPLTGAAVWLLGPEATELAVDLNRGVAQKADCGLCKWQLAKVMRFIEEDLEARIQVDDLCSLVRLSAYRSSTCFRISAGQSHLFNMFKRMVGVTPLVWRRRQWHGEIGMMPQGIATASKAAQAVGGQIA